MSNTALSITTQLHSGSGSLCYEQPHQTGDSNVLVSGGNRVRQLEGNEADGLHVMPNLEGKSQYTIACSINTYNSSGGNGDV